METNGSLPLAHNPSQSFIPAGVETASVNRVAHCVRVLPPPPFSLFLSIFLTFAIHVSEAASVPGRSKSSGSVFYGDQRKLIDQQWVC